jgi:hypothetical protein
MLVRCRPGPTTPVMLVGRCKVVASTKDLNPASLTVARRMRPAAAGNAAGDRAGQPVLQMPQDLYIPPDALEVILDAFEGPARPAAVPDPPPEPRHPRHPGRRDHPPVRRLHRHDAAKCAFELAAEYLVMAAILAEIKSRLLLPRPPGDEGIEDDPRAELVRRLQEYERFKKAAEDIDALPRRNATLARPGLRPRSQRSSACRRRSTCANAAGAQGRAQARRAVQPPRHQARSALGPPAHERPARRSSAMASSTLSNPVQSRRKVVSASSSPSSPCSNWPRKTCSKSPRTTLRTDLRAHQVRRRRSRSEAES